MVLEEVATVDVSGWWNPSALASRLNEIKDDIETVSSSIEIVHNDVQSRISILVQNGGEKIATSTQGVQDEDLGTAYSFIRAHLDEVMENCASFSAVLEESCGAVNGDELDSMYAQICEALNYVNPADANAMDELAGLVEKYQQQLDEINTTYQNKREAILAALPDEEVVKSVVSACEKLERDKPDTAWAASLQDVRDKTIGLPEDPVSEFAQV